MNGLDNGHKGEHMGQIKLNSNGVNANIKAHIIDEKTMRKIGFTDNDKDTWYFVRTLKFPQNPNYKRFDITFNVSIPKDGSAISIDVLDEDFLQPYDYKYMLKNNANFEPALIAKEQVENIMEDLQSKKVISGYIRGEYI